MPIKGPQRIRISPQYGRNVRNIDPTSKIGLRPAEESRIITANKPMGKKKIP